MMLDTKFNLFKRAITKVAINNEKKDNLINQLLDKKQFPLISKDEDFLELNDSLRDPVIRLQFSEQIKQNLKSDMPKSLKHVLGKFCCCVMLFSCCCPLGNFICIYTFKKI